MPSGGWRARWLDQHGRPQSKGSKAWTKRDALRYERTRLEERDRLPWQSDTTTTLGEWTKTCMRRWRHLAPATVVSYEAEINNHILPNLGERTPLARITDEAIEAWIEGDQGAPASVQRRYVICKALLSEAVKKGRLTANPMVHVRPPRLVHREMRFVTLEELLAIAEVITPRYALLAPLVGTVGLRQAETWALRPEHFDFRSRQITIYGTKSRRALRAVTMSEHVAERTERHLAEWGNDWVFPSKTGRPPHSLGGWRESVWYPAVAAAGIEGKVRPHDLRHTAAALAILAGAHPVALQRMLGHATSTFTMDTYGHLFPSLDASIASGIDTLWPGSDKDEDG